VPRGPLRWLAAAIAAQYALGVATLLAAVPIVLGTLHQIGAALALSAVLAVMHTTRPPMPREHPP
jgi:cytochrome c oxidase assembly protein subunit 15